MMDDFEAWLDGELSQRRDEPTAHEDWESAASTAWVELSGTAKWVAQSTSQIEQQIHEAGVVAGVYRDPRNMEVERPAASALLPGTGSHAKILSGEGDATNFGGSYLSLPIIDRQEVALTVKGMVEAVAAAIGGTLFEGLKNDPIAVISPRRSELEATVRRETRNHMERLKAMAKAREEGARTVAQAVALSGATVATQNARETADSEACCAAVGEEMMRRLQKLHNDDAARAASKTEADQQLLIYLESELAASDEIAAVERNQRMAAAAQRRSHVARTLAAVTLQTAARARMARLVAALRRESAIEVEMCRERQWKEVERCREAQQRDHARFRSVVSLQCQWRRRLARSVVATTQARSIRITRWRHRRKPHGFTISALQCRWRAFLSACEILGLRRRSRHQRDEAAASLFSGAELEVGVGQHKLRRRRSLAVGTLNDSSRVVSLQRWQYRESSRRVAKGTAYKKRHKHQSRREHRQLDHTRITCRAPCCPSKASTRGGMSFAVVGSSWAGLRSRGCAQKISNSLESERRDISVDKESDVLNTVEKLDIVGLAAFFSIDFRDGDAFAPTCTRLRSKCFARSSLQLPQCDLEELRSGHQDDTCSIGSAAAAVLLFGASDIQHSIAAVFLGRCLQQQRGVEAVETAQDAESKISSRGGIEEDEEDDKVATILRPSAEDNRGARSELMRQLQEAEERRKRYLLGMLQPAVNSSAVSYARDGSGTEPQHFEKSIEAIVAPLVKVGSALRVTSMHPGEHKFWLGHPVANMTSRVHRARSEAIEVLVHLQRVESSPLSAANAPLVPQRWHSLPKSTANLTNLKKCGDDPSILTKELLMAIVSRGSSPHLPSCSYAIPVSTLPPSSSTFGTDLSTLLNLELDVEGLRGGLEQLREHTPMLQSLSLNVNKLEDLECAGLLAAGNMYECNLTTNAAFGSDTCKCATTLQGLPLRRLSLCDNGLRSIRGLGAAFAGNRVASRGCHGGLEELHLDVNSLSRLDANDLNPLGGSLLYLSGAILKAVIDHIPSCKPTNPHSCRTLLVKTVNTNHLVDWPSNSSEHGGRLFLPHLQYLACNHNGLLGLPTDALQGTPCLTHLDLGCNRLTSVSGAVLSVVKSLTSLVLSQNRLEEVPSPLRLPLLRKFWLGGNSISSLSPWTFAPGQCADTTAKTVALGISSNIRWHDRGLDGRDTSTWLPSLEELYLHDNKVAHIPAGVFIGMPMLHFLDLAFNRLSPVADDILVNLWRHGLNGTSKISVRESTVERQIGSTLFAHSPTDACPLWSALTTCGAAEMSFSCLAGLWAPVGGACDNLVSLNLKANPIATCLQSIGTQAHLGLHRHRYERDLTSMVVRPSNVRAGGPSAVTRLALINENLNGSGAGNNSAYDDNNGTDAAPYMLRCPDWELDPLLLGYICQHLPSLRIVNGNPLGQNRSAIAAVCASLGGMQFQQYARSAARGDVPLSGFPMALDSRRRLDSCRGSTGDVCHNAPMNRSGTNRICVLSCTHLIVPCLRVYLLFHNIDRRVRTNEEEAHLISGYWRGEIYMDTMEDRWKGQKERNVGNGGLVLVSEEEMAMAEAEGSDTNEGGAVDLSRAERQSNASREQSVYQKRRETAILSLWCARRWRCRSCRGPIRLRNFGRGAPLFSRETLDCVVNRGDGRGICAQCGTIQAVPPLFSTVLMPSDDIFSTSARMNTATSGLDVPASFYCHSYVPCIASPQSSAFEREFIWSESSWNYTAFESIAAWQRRHFDSVRRRRYASPTSNGYDSLLSVSRIACRNQECHMATCEPLEKIALESVAKALDKMAGFELSGLQMPAGVEDRDGNKSRPEPLPIPRTHQWKRLRAFGWQAKEVDYLTTESLREQFLVVDSPMMVTHCTPSCTANDSWQDEWRQRWRSKWFRHETTRRESRAHGEFGVRCCNYEEVQMRTAKCGLWRSLRCIAWKGSACFERLIVGARTIVIRGFAEAAAVKWAAGICAAAVEVQKIWRGALQRIRDAVPAKELASSVIQRLFRGFRVRRAIAVALQSSAFDDPELEALFSDGEGLLSIAFDEEPDWGPSNVVDKEMWKRRRQGMVNIATAEFALGDVQRAALSPTEQRRLTSPIVVRRVRQHQQRALELYRHDGADGNEANDTSDIFSAYDRLGPSVSRPGSSISQSSEASTGSSGHWAIAVDDWKSRRSSAISGISSTTTAQQRTPTAIIQAPGVVARDRAKHRSAKRKKKKQHLPAWAVMPPIRP